MEPTGLKRHILIIEGLDSPCILHVNEAARRKSLAAKCGLLWTSQCKTSGIQLHFPEELDHRKGTKAMESIFRFEWSLNILRIFNTECALATSFLSSD